MPNSITSSHAYCVPLYHTFLLCLPTRLSTLNNFVIVCLLMAYACITFSDLPSFFGFTHAVIYTLQYCSLDVILLQFAGNQHNTVIYEYQVSIVVLLSYYYQKVHII
jgi:hypothetical protein